MNVAELRIPEKGPSEMYTVQMTIAPDQAQQWLDAMPVQRRMRGSRVEQLRRLIAEGRWRVLPHGLVFDKDGHIIDGQHRLTAIVQAGKPVPIRCTFNAESDMFNDIGDAESGKSIDDMLKREGVLPGMAMIMAAGVRMLFRNERGMSPLSTSLFPSNAEAREVFLRNPDLIVATEMAMRCRFAPARSNLVYPLFKGLAADRVVTGLFVDQLATGEGLRSGDPALLLRNSWIQDRQHKLKREVADQLVMVFTALRDAIRGKKRSTWRSVEFGKGKIPSLEAAPLV